MLQSNQPPNPALPTTSPPKNEHFDQPVLLQQSPVWSRAIAMGIAGITAFTLIWAAVFKIEEAIPAQGKLEPTGAVKEIQVPVGGVVKAIHVEDGQSVKAGDRLVSLDPTAAAAQQSSLTKIRTALQQENEFYRRQQSGDTSPAQIEQQLALLKISPELATLTKNRATLLSENQLYRAQLSGGTGAALTPDQQLRLRTRRDEIDSKIAAAQLEAGQAERQLRENQVKLANAKELLTINQKILSDLQPLLKDGGIAKLQVLRQQQDVMSRKAEVEQLQQEQARLQLEIAQANETLRNTAALSQEDLLARISENEKRVAEIDSQLTRVVRDNDAKINEIESQLSQANLTLKYQEILAPVSGTIFDLKPSSPGYVVNTSEPVLKVVPNNNLVAKVFITNKDIGFVKEGQTVDVRIDSFPFSEYGDVKGKLVSIGSDALPPDQIYQFYRFPAKVELDRQSLLINGREVRLQSGMSINANIKLRKRTVLSIFTDLFVKKVESLKFVR
jgi:hemolysin D